MLIGVVPKCMACLIGSRQASKIIQEGVLEPEKATLVLPVTLAGCLTMWVGQSTGKGENALGRHTLSVRG